MKKNRCLVSWLLIAVMLLSLLLLVFAGCSKKEIQFDLGADTQEIVITSDNESVTLNGSLTQASILSVEIKEGDTPLYLYLNNVNAVGADGVNIIAGTGSRETHIVVSGQNSLEALHTVAVNCPSSNLYLEGDGVLTISGGTGMTGDNGINGGESGTAGADGFEALIANNVTVTMTNTLTLTGGNGGNGGNGAEGVKGTNGSDKGWFTNDVTSSLGHTENGGDGGDGGNGAAGGQGADSIRVTTLTVTSGKVILQGGSGGNGGNGGNGGKGGHGGKNSWWDGYKGGHPGNGGDGGNGGDAAYGGNVGLEERLTIVSSGSAQVTTTQGSNGTAGRGGKGGAIGDPSGDSDGDVPHDCYAGKSGAAGNAIVSETDTSEE